LKWRDNTPSLQRSAQCEKLKEMANSNRTKFVSVMAWVMIVLCAISLLGIGFEMVIFSWVVPEGTIDDVIRQVSAISPISPSILWTLQHLLTVFTIAAFLSLIMLAAAIGLLKRQEWARKTVIGIIAFWTLVGWVSILFQDSMTAQLLTPPPGTPQEVIDELARAASTMRLMSIVFNAVVTVLHGWIIWKLFQPEILREFTPPVPGAGSDPAASSAS
jgi:hypothetical protein